LKRPEDFYEKTQPQRIYKGGRGQKEKKQALELCGERRIRDMKKRGVLLGFLDGKNNRRHEKSACRGKKKKRNEWARLGPLGTGETGGSNQILYGPQGG